MEPGQAWDLQEVQSGDETDGQGKRVTLQAEKPGKAKVSSRSHPHGEEIWVFWGTIWRNGDGVRRKNVREQTMRGWNL